MSDISTALREDSFRVIFLGNITSAQEIHLNEMVCTKLHLTKRVGLIFYVNKTELCAYKIMFNLSNTERVSIHLCKVLLR